MLRSARPAVISVATKLDGKEALVHEVDPLPTTLYFGGSVSMKVSKLITESAISTKSFIFHESTNHTKIIDNGTKLDGNSRCFILCLIAAKAILCLILVVKTLINCTFSKM